jgi:hypothetical protein
MGWRRGTVRWQRKIEAGRGKGRIDERWGERRTGEREVERADDWSQWWRERVTGASGGEREGQESEVERGKSSSGGGEGEGQEEEKCTEGSGGQE